MNITNTLPSLPSPSTAYCGLSSISLVYYASPNAPTTLWVNLCNP